MAVPNKRLTPTKTTSNFITYVLHPGTRMSSIKETGICLVMPVNKQWVNCDKCDTIVCHLCIIPNEKS